MKNEKSFVVFLMLMLAMSVSGFAVSYQSVSLGDTQTLLFTFEDERINKVQLIKDLEYDQANQHVYVMTGNKETYKDLDGRDSLETDQLVFTLEGVAVDKPVYPIEGNEFDYLNDLDRFGLELDGQQAWSLEYDQDASSSYIYNFDDHFYQGYGIGNPRGFAVSGDHFLYFYKGCWDEMNYATGVTWANVDHENMINVDLDMKMAYDLSPDGQEIIVAGTLYSNNSDNPEEYGCYVVRLNFTTHEEIDRFFIGPDQENYHGQAMDLYATDNEIVVMYKDTKLDLAYIDRYTYDGRRIDGLEVSYCVRQMAEGPDGSTLYIQRKAVEDESYPLEVIQIDWKPWMTSSSVGSPKHLVTEKTRGGRTIADFDNGRFGLLKVFDQETGEKDLRLPIRSDKSLVKVRIPYEDIVEQIASARNVKVEYKGQTLAIPMSVFDCAALLPGMPCQDDATIEIILQADDEGNVTYSIQLFVVEELNAMTKLVHRKTIQ